LIFLGQTVLVCQSYNGGLWGSPTYLDIQEITMEDDFDISKYV